jgi:hypothetical protein
LLLELEISSVWNDRVSGVALSGHHNLRNLRKATESDQHKFRRILETLFSLELAITEQIDFRHGSFLATVSEGKLGQGEYTRKVIISLL